VFTLEIKEAGDRVEIVEVLLEINQILTLIGSGEILVIPHLLI